MFVWFTTGFHMFTDDVRSGGRGGSSTASCSALLKPTHMVIVQLIYVIQGLDNIGWLLDTDEKKD